MWISQSFNVYMHNIFEYELYMGISFYFLYVPE